MRKFSNARPALAIAAWLFASGGAFAADLFAQPYYAGGYAPAPINAYQGYGQDYGQGYRIVDEDGDHIGTVQYEQGYYYGGYQYPAGGYGGGDYRRAAYSAADVYVSHAPAYPRAYAAPQPGWRPYPVPHTGWRPYARGYAAPVAGLHDAPGYRPYGGPRPHRHCRTLY